MRTARGTGIRIVASTDGYEESGSAGRTNGAAFAFKGFRLGRRPRRPPSPDASPGFPDPGDPAVMSPSGIRPAVRRSPFPLTPVLTFNELPPTPRQTGGGLSFLGTLPLVWPRRLALSGPN